MTTMLQGVYKNNGLNGVRIVVETNHNRTLNFWRHFEKKGKDWNIIPRYINKDKNYGEHLIFINESF